MALTRPSGPTGGRSLGDRPALQSPQADAFDAGLLSDHGGGNVDWWWDYIRSLLGAAHDHYVSQLEARHG
jgi:hypothetical protein